MRSITSVSLRFLIRRLLRCRFYMLLLLLLVVLLCLMTFIRMLTNAATRRGFSRIADVIVSEPLAFPRAGSITSLPQWLSTRRVARVAFGDVFELHEDTAPLVIPQQFREKAIAMFSNYGATRDELLRALEEQRVVSVRNRATGDAVAFNDVRRFRPGGGNTKSEDHNGPADTGGPDCDFCSRVRMANDVFGRISGRHAFTVANVAKLSRWHGLVVTYAHDPLAFSVEVIADVLDVSHQWFRRVHLEDPRHAFPNILCDIGPRASASQPHFHLQTALTRERHFAGADQWMRAARAHGRSYWSKFVRAHDAVGLAVRVGRSVVLSSACPRKERELIVLADDPEDPSFALAVAIALMTLRDAARVRTMSFALTFPPLDEAGRYRLGEAPAVLRVIDRGNPSDPRADTGALEYFGTAYIATDPFDIVPHLVRARNEAQTHV